MCLHVFSFFFFVAAFLAAFPSALKKINQYIVKNVTLEGLMPLEQGFPDRCFPIIVSH